MLLECTLCSLLCLFLTNTFNIANYYVSFSLNVLLKELYKSSDKSPQLSWTPKKGYGYSKASKTFSKILGVSALRRSIPGKQRKFRKAKESSRKILWGQPHRKLCKRTYKKKTRIVIVDFEGDFTTSWILLFARVDDCRHSSRT